MFFTGFLSMLSTVIVGGEGAPVGGAAEPGIAAGAAETADLGGLFGGGGLMMVVIYAVVIGAMWFILIRPQRKRDKAMREMQAALKIGDNVITSSGFYGKIVSQGDDYFDIEFGTNKGVRIPVRKGDVIGVKTPGKAAQTEE